MSTTIEGLLVDGETLGAIPITAIVTAGRLVSVNPACNLDVSLGDVRVSDRLADVPRFLYLPRNRTVETADNAAVDALLGTQKRGRTVRLVHALESHARVVAVATVLLVALAATAVWWGLPALARRAALAVPESIEAQAGRAGLAALDRVLAPSKLGRSRRQNVQEQLDRLMQNGALAGTPEIAFRSMGEAFPNAFALPGGLIIMSDEIVTLADDDDELAAVLAHEIAHWQRRHGLQRLLRSSTALLVVSTVTGDLSTLTTFASTIPFTLLQQGYSREFETEADAYAVALLIRAKIDPAAFAAVLGKLEDSRPKKGSDFTYLSTHPGTAERISQVHVLAQRLGWTSPPVEPLPLTPEPASLIAPSAEAQPEALTRQAPFYPHALREAKISGTVVVEFIVNRRGNVQNVVVVRSSHPGFENPAIAAIKQWKFKPGRKNGRIVSVTASQLLEFNWDGATMDKPPITPTDAWTAPAAADAN